MMSKRSLFFSTVLLVLVFASAHARVLPKDYENGQAVSAAWLGPLQQQLENRRLAYAMKSYISLFLKTPHQKPFVWDGALWLYQPTTLTFQAVDDFGNTLFYFRHTYDRGWLVEHAGKTKSIPLPVDGRKMIDLIVGRMPPLPTTLRIVSHTPITLTDGDDEVWVLSADGLPLGYHYFARRARKSYSVTWQDWREHNGIHYPTQVHFQSRKGRLQFKLTHHDSDLK